MTNMAAPTLSGLHHLKIPVLRLPPSKKPPTDTMFAQLESWSLAMKTVRRTTN
jgi:hypothetical protein